MKGLDNLPLNKEEWSDWVNLTKRIRFVDDKIPKEAFFAWCEYFYTVPMELMGFRIVNQKPEILLIYRKDEYYDGYHVPGAVLIPGQKIEDALSNLLKRELGDNVRINHLEFVKYFEMLKGSGIGQNSRGHEIKIVFAGKIEGEPKNGEWFAKNNLPNNIIPGFVYIIPYMFDWAEKNLTK